jgi:putative DNA primase/helicase
VSDTVTEVGVSVNSPGAPKEAFDDPCRLARGYLNSLRLEKALAHCPLRFWEGEWWRWRDNAYRPVPDDEVLADLNGYVKNDFNQLALKQGEKVRKVKKAFVSDVAFQVKNSCLLPSGSVKQPSWLTGEYPPAEEFLATKNKLIHLPSLMAGQPESVYALAHSPDYFCPVALDFDFDPDAPPPAAWLAFLDSLWGDDPDSVRLLQEFAGYLLTLDTGMQKMLFNYGPPCSGKGTVRSVLEGLVGERNCAYPTMANLAGNFGLWDLVNKSVAFIPDARVGEHTNKTAVLERLLSIVGEDPLTVDRKHISAVNRKLFARVVVSSNELFNLQDTSGALARRLLVLHFRRSWEGKEDLHLKAKLAAELPGILLWAVEGLQRLRGQGKFTQPASGRAVLRKFVTQNSPLRAFVEDRCEFGAAYKVSVDQLFNAYLKWRQENDMEADGVKKEGFGRAFNERYPDLPESAPERVNGGKPARFRLGVRLKAA